MRTPGKTVSLNRRDCLQGILAGVASLSAITPSLARAAITDLASPSERLRVLMLLRAALDNRVTIEWLRGRVYGVVGAERTPLFTLNAVAFASYTRTGPDTYAGRRVEVVYHGDLDTGEKLESFRNPYTNEDVAVPPQRTPPSGFELGVNGLSFPAQMGPMRVTTNSSIAEPDVHDGAVWVRMDTRTEFKLPGDAPASLYAESMVYSGDLDAVAAADAISVPSALSYSNVMSWRPWMGMPVGHPGHTVANGNGVKAEALAEVPADLRQFVESEHPDLANDAVAALSPSSSAGN